MAARLMKGLITIDDVVKPVPEPTEKKRGGYKKR
jgi:hypothetical protein